jgi:hypothetical protein
LAQLLVQKWRGRHSRCGRVDCNTTGTGIATAKSSTTTKPYDTLTFGLVLIQLTELAKYALLN